MLRRHLALFFMIAVVWFVEPAMADDAPAPPAPISLGGAVEHPGDMTIDELRKLPVTTETVFFHTGHGAATATYAGVSLWTLLQNVGIKADPATRNDLLHKYIIAAGSDGYFAVLALAEIHPEFGGQQVIVAYDQDGKPLGEGASARLIVPGDKGGGRNVMKLRSITVHDAQP
jgi:DMSO/TMAO reductase YedYZ molybdopterin-dependent catalytic subunit